MSSGFILTILILSHLFIDIDGGRLSAGKSSKRAKNVTSIAMSSKRPARRAATPKASGGKRKGSPTTVKEKPSKRIAGRGSSKGSSSKGKAKDDIAGE